MPRRRLVVFSGGSAANSIVDVFNGLLIPGKGGHGDHSADVDGNGGAGGGEHGLQLHKLTYVIGISDNGGSTSEILRVFGGPGIGDVRSRLIRLVPDPVGSEEDNEAKVAIKQLLNYRLPADEVDAKEEWLEIVEGTHIKWRKIPSDRRELLRSFLVHLHSEILKRARPPTSTFNFHSASIGNLFLTSARLFFGSFESAIYLFHSVTGVPEYVQVVPAINSMFAHHIAAGLADGTVIVGQNQISHPTDRNAASLLPNSENIYSTAPSGAVTPVTPFIHGYGQQRLHPLHTWLTLGLTPRQVTDSDDTGGLAKEGEDEGEEGSDTDTVEDANLPGSHPSLRAQNIVFEKENEPELESRIERVWYINPYGQEIRPPANPKVLQALSKAGVVVFSIGSLYTSGVSSQKQSIIPCLVLRGIGQKLSSPLIPYKILILNGSLDRETGPVTRNPTADCDASDFIRAIVRACLDSQSRKLKGSSLSTTATCHPFPPSPRSQTFSPQMQQLHPHMDLFIPPSEYTKFVTHLIYLPGPGTPRVNPRELRSWGIQCVPVRGKFLEGKKGMYYDVARLKEALARIIYGPIAASSGAGVGVRN